MISGQDAHQAAMEKGALGFLEKPVTAEALHGMFARFNTMKTMKQLLIVEDHEGNMLAIKDLLQGEDIQITCARSGKAAYEALLSHDYDCVVLDLGLPDMTGFDLLEMLSKNRSLHIPPVVVYTGHDLTEEEYQQLSRYTRSIVIKNPGSRERLLDDTSLFLHRVEGNLREEQRRIIRMLHQSDQIPGHNKILVVDDDMRNAYALSTTLQDWGCTVVIAGDGQAALDALDRDDEVTLVLMDIMMPVMDGYEAIRRIRQSDRYGKIPIIALTALASADDRASCIEAGATDYLTKPVDLQKLVSLMKVWLLQ